MYLKDLLISPTIWCALFICVAMCFSNVRCESTLTPISFSPSTISNDVTDPSYVFMVYDLSSTTFLLFLIFNTLHLSGWNFKSHCALQSNKLSRSSCKIVLSSSTLMFRYNFVSFANRYVVDDTLFGRSLMNITNRIGPRTDPYGMPLVTPCHLENLPFRCTLCFRWLRKLSTHVHDCSLIPYDLNL